MKKNWYVVAHRAGARFFEQVGVAPTLVLRKTLDNPEGRLSERERSGSTVGAVPRTGGAGMHTLSTEQSSTEQVEVKFSRAVGDEVNAAAKRGEYDYLVLVAEPHFLGRLKKQLDTAANQRLRTTVAKDLARVDDAEVSAHLGEALFTREPV